MRSRAPSILLVILPVILALTPVQALAADKPASKGEFKGAHFVEIPQWFKNSFLDLRDDITDAKDSNKRVMLYFHQDGCPYCAKLVKENFTNKKIVDYMARHIDAVEMNMWGDKTVTGLDGKEYTEKAFAEKLKVWFTPTILFFDKTGKVVLRVNGYYDSEKFMTALRYVAEKKEKAMSFTEYSRQFASTNKPARLAEESFYLKPPYNLAELKKSAKPIAIYFEQGNCKDCNSLHKNVFTQQDTLDQLARYNVIQLDRWSNTPLTGFDGKQTTAKKLADQLGIAYIPSAVMYVDGKEVIRIEAFLKAFHVQSVLDYAASGAFKTEPSLQRFIEARAEHVRAQGKTVDLWK